MTLDELKALAIDDIISMEIELHTEEGSWRYFASMRSVFTALPARRGMLDGATTSQSKP